MNFFSAPYQSFPSIEAEMSPPLQFTAVDNRKQDKRLSSIDRQTSRIFHENFGNDYVVPDVSTNIVRVQQPFVAPVPVPVPVPVLPQGGTIAPPQATTSGLGFFDQLVVNNKERVKREFDNLTTQADASFGGGIVPPPLLDWRFPLLQDTSGSKNCDPFRAVISIPITTAPKVGLPGRAAV